MQSKMSEETPAQLGFTMSAEWEKHSAVWLAWPYDDTTFPGRVKKAELVFVEIIKAIYESDVVNLLVLDDNMSILIGAMLKEAGVDIKKINFITTKYADVWTRDYGPTFLLNRQNKSLAWVKWEYNAYGKADDPYFAPVLTDKDVFNNLELPGQKFNPGIVLEGGSVEVNGQGVLITTEQCLLNSNRNPGLNKEQIENYLKSYLGVKKIIWLPRGLVNDHTDGHIDDIAKFVAPDRIVVACEDDPSDENFSILNDNYEILKNSTDQNREPFEVIKVPMPHMRYEEWHSVHSTDGGDNSSQSEKAAVSYLNFYISNLVVLVPTFKDANDAMALKIIQDCFPDRKVVGIDCSDIIYGGGSIHCMTQQQPAL